MKIMPIMEITSPGRLTSTTAVDAPAYAGGTSYALSALVTDGGREYRSLQAANLGHAPAASPTFWQDMGVRNVMKMFDAEQNSATSAPSPLVVGITPGQRFTTVTAFGVRAHRVTISITVAGVEQYTKTIKLLRRNTRSWSEYLFGSFVYTDFALFIDLPPYANAVLTVTFTRSSGNVEVESFAMGTAIEVGFAQNGAQSDILDFSKADRDDFGGIKFTKRKNIPTASIPVKIDKVTADKLRLLRKQLAGQPAVFIGVSDVEDGFAGLFAFLGFFRRMPIIAEYWNGALVNFELEGL